MYVLQFSDRIYKYDIVKTLLFHWRINKYKTYNLLHIYAVCL